MYSVNMPAYELFDLVNEFDKTYYKDIHERGSIGVPFSGLTVSIFPQTFKNKKAQLKVNLIMMKQEDPVGMAMNKRVLRKKATEWCPIVLKKMLKQKVQYTIYY